MYVPGRFNLDSAVDGMKVDQSVVAIEHSRECQAPHTNRASNVFSNLNASTNPRPKVLTDFGEQKLEAGSQV